MPLRIAASSLPAWISRTLAAMPLTSSRAADDAWQAIDIASGRTYKAAGGKTRGESDNNLTTARNRSKPGSGPAMLSLHGMSGSPGRTAGLGAESRLKLSVGVRLSGVEMRKPEANQIRGNRLWSHPNVW